MRIDETTPSGTDIAVGPASLSGALDLTVDAVRSAAAALRAALTRREPAQAWTAFVALRRILSEHLRWETEDLAVILEVQDLLDLPGDVRTMRAWHDLLIDTLADIDAELSEPSAEPIRAFKKADHEAARLVALCEDYRSDQERGQYRSLDDDVERHDRELARREALMAWSHRMAARNRATS